LSNETWGASPSPLTHGAAGDAGAGEGLALPKRYVCKLGVSDNFWVGAELKDFIIGDAGWVGEYCKPYTYGRYAISLSNFKTAMYEARSVLAMKHYRFLAIVSSDRAGVMIIRYDREAKVLQTRYRFDAEIQAFVELIGDGMRNLKKVDRKHGLAYMGAITFTIDQGLIEQIAEEYGDVAPQFVAEKYLGIAISQFWNRFSKRYGRVLWVCVEELQQKGYPHVHCVFWVERPLRVFRKSGKWRFDDKREWELWYPLGNIDAFALPKLRHAVNYLKKYLTKQYPSVSQESQDLSQPDQGENWKGWEIEFRWLTRGRIVRACKEVKRRARQIMLSRRLTRSDIVEKKKLPIATVGGVYIKIDSKALVLANVFRNYVLASERHRSAQGIVIWIDHPSVQLYSDLISIFTSLDVSDPLRIRLYIADLRRGLDPPPDLWLIMFQIWVIDRFTR